MIKKDNVVQTKSEQFALRIVKCCQYLSTSKREKVLSNQLLRAGTSIGANITEAEYAQSVLDFYNKMQIALKEAAESRYWIELLYHGNYLDKEQYGSLLGDVQDIINILVKISKSKKSKDL